MSPVRTQLHLSIPEVVAPAGTRVLGLDVGLRFGWALLDERGKRITSGTLRLDRYESGPMRAYQAEGRIAALFEHTAKQTHVAYEIVRRHEGVQAAHVYGGLRDSLYRACHRMSILPETVEVADVKRVATGKGNAPKPEMLAAARLRWGPEIAGDDEADACFIAEVLRRRLAKGFVARAGVGRG